MTMPPLRIESAGRLPAFDYVIQPTLQTAQAERYKAKIFA